MRKSPEKPRYTKEEALEEASKIKDKIETRKAENYEEAEKMVKYESLWKNKVEEKIKTGEAKEYKKAEEMLAEETIKNLIDGVERIKYDPYSLTFYRRYLGSEEDRFKLAVAIEKLPYDKSIKEISNLVEALDENIKTYPREYPTKEQLIGEISRAFLKVKVKPGKELEEFLNSPMEKFVSVEEILKKMGREKADAETIKKLLKKYKDINFKKLDLFGENGIFNKFEKREKEKMLDEVISTLEKQTEKSIKKMEEERTETSIWSITSYGIDWEEANVESRLKHIEAAAKEGIILPNYKERIRKIYEATYYYPNTYSETAVRFQQEEIERIAILVEKAAGEKPKEITGEGLEFLESEYSSAKRVYLDGELIGSFVNASFGEKATNGEMVAWIVSEVIDRDLIAGIQNRDTVYVWKKGWKEPKEIFEDHAWSSERYFRVLPPEVTPDGKVKIKRISGEKTIEEEFEME